MKKVIKLVGEVAWYDISAEYIESELKGLTKDDEIEFIVFSGGGSVFEGAYIHNLIASCPAKKIGYNYGLCASMMTIIGLAFDEFYSCTIAGYMTHNVSGVAGGTSKDLKETAILLDKLDILLFEGYKKRGISEDVIKSQLLNGKDNWFTPQEAVDLGLIDGIREPNKEIIESDAKLAEFNYNELMDVAAANVGNCSKAFNKFVNLNFNKMKKENEEEVVNATLNDSDPSKIISQLQNESNNWKKEVLDKNTVISSLEIERDTVKAQLESIQKEASEKIAKFEKEANEAKELLNAKDIQLQKEKIENAVKLAVSDMRVTYPLLSAADGEKLATDFINRHAITLTNEVVTVIDKITQGISDNIPSAVTHFAITTNYVQATKVGFGKSVNANLSSSDVSNSYKAQQEEQENKQIEHHSKALQKQGIGKGGKDWCLAMLDKFPNSEKAVPKVLKEKFNLK